MGDLWSDHGLTKSALKYIWWQQGKFEYGS